MTIFNSLLSGMAAVFIVMNLALLVAAVVWAMGGFPGQPTERKLARAPARSRHPKTCSHS
jgi:Na+-transporting methylmalonyl-CoA/oxaloacetate decarboxylase gamma subunit